MYKKIKELLNEGYTLTFAPDFDGKFIITLSKTEEDQRKKCDAKASFEFMENVSGFPKDEMLELMIDQTRRKFDLDFKPATEVH